MLKLKKISFGIIAALLSIGILLLLGEALVRVSGFFECEFWNENDPLMVNYNKFNYYGRLKNKGEYDNRFYLNKYGMRGKEINLEKGKDVVRIVCLGDSFTIALQLPEKYIYTSLLDSFLKEHGYNAEVVNLGRDGAGACLEYLYLQHIGLQFKPDILILAYTFNDLIDDWRDKDKVLFDSGGCPLRAKPVRILHPLLNKSHLYKFQKLMLRKMKYKIRNETEIKREPDWRKSSISESTFAIFKKEYNEQDIQVFENSFKFLRCLEKLCEKNNIKFFLCLIPPGVQVSSDEWTKGKAIFWFTKNEFIRTDKWQSMIKDFCKSNKIPVLDLLPILREKSKGNLYFAYDGHLTKKGHKVVAESLFNFLKEYLPFSSRVKSD